MIEVELWLALGLAALDLIAVVLAIWHILLHKREPAAALLWTLIVILVPLAGTLAYVAVGVNRHGRRATVKELRNLAARRQLRPLTHALLPDPLTGDDPDDTARPPLEVASFPTHLEPFAVLMSRIGRYRAVNGNEVRFIPSGQGFLDEARAAIAGAERSVMLETYIFDCDEVGRELLELLGAACERGVHCYLLYDAVGSLTLDPAELDRAQDRGVRIEAFDQRSMLRGRFQVNLRNHRKILVVDGATGWTGGTNVSADHLDATPEHERSEDVHLAVRGPAVAQLSAVFAEDWYSTTGQPLAEAIYFPDLTPHGEGVCRVLPSGPDGDRGAFHRLLVAALHGARHHIQIVTPYFIPSQAVSLALQVAAMRGVHVELTLPDTPDHKFIRWATNAYLQPLLDAGVHIRRRPGAFLHAKVLVIDELWALLGSSNVDPRSFWLNYELNVGITGHDAVAEISAWARETWRDSTIIDPKTFRARGAGARAWENFWALFSPML